MKTMMKLGVVFAAVLLVATILVTGCTPETSGYTPPDGMGAVQIKLSLDNPNARATIMPGNATINTFQRFHLDFQPATATPGQAFNQYYTYAQLGTGNPINLAPGGYILKVIAFMDAGTPPTEAAAVGEASFTVTGGASNYAVPVVLHAYDPDEGDEEGTFAWNITVTNLTVASLSAATMTVTPIGTGDPYGPYNLLTGTVPNDWVNATGVAVVEGFYYVNFSLTSLGVTRTYRHVLQIYRNHTSTFIYEFTDAKLGIVATTVIVTPTYQHPLDNPPVVVNNSNGDASVADEATLTLTTPITLEITNAGDYDSISWWSGAERGTGTTFTVSTTNAPFSGGRGTYSLTIIGFSTAAKAADLNTYEGAPFDIEIFIEIQ
jgi:hypothetical protein